MANSFQVATKSRMKSAASTGSETGRKMRRKIGEVRGAVDQRPPRRAPSAPSLKKPWRMKTWYGTPKAR